MATDPAAKSPWWFVRLTDGQIFNRSQILSIRKTSASKGADGVQRNWVVTVSPESVGGAQYNKIWLTEDEARRIERVLVPTES